ncbi:MAG: hypothetical protein KA403_00560 [Candidatus Omnitrophica bacterium]|nr:hypothetical protein [Candidatus Omnitrophota bacterium]
MDENTQAQLDKQQQFFERARKGVLQHLNDQGCKLNMSELHEYSLKKYLIQHQRFSQMMESFVAESLVEFDWGTQDVTLTEAGRKFLDKAV